MPLVHQRYVHNLFIIAVTVFITTFTINLTNVAQQQRYKYIIDTENNHKSEIQHAKISTRFDHELCAILTKMTLQQQLRLSTIIIRSHWHLDRCTQ
jgi:hypothetical protein